MNDFQDRNSKLGQSPIRNSGSNQPRPGNSQRNRAGAGQRPGPQSRPSRPSYGQAGRPRPRPDYPQPSDYQQDVAAAQRAARQAMDQQDDYVYSPYDSSYGSESSYPGINSYVDDLFTDDVIEEEGLPAPLKLAIGIGVALVVLILAFFIIRAIIGRQGSDARLVRNTTEKRGPIETTSVVTTSARTTEETSAEVTLPPRGTDPYHNPPVWVPPTQAPTPSQEIAPPPVVVVNTSENITEPVVPDEPVPPIVENPVPTAPPVDPPPTAGQETPTAAPPNLNPPAVSKIRIFQGQAQTPQYAPTAPPAEGETVENQYAPTAPPPAIVPSYGDTSSEGIPVELPPAQDVFEHPMPQKEQGQVVRLPGMMAFVQMDANGQYVLNSYTGNVKEAFTSLDNQNVIVQTEDDQFLYFGEGRDPQIISVSSPFGLEKLVGARGLGYISNGQLYYMNYYDQAVQVVQENVTDAIIADQVERFLAVANSGVRIQDLSGNYTELLEPYSSTGNIVLDYFSPDGEVAIFQDDLRVYIYNPRLFGEQVLRVNKLQGGFPARVEVNPGSNEVLLIQDNTSAVIRISPVGGIEQVYSGEWNLGLNSIVLAGGSTSNGIYSNLVVVNQGNLYLSNPSRNMGEGKFSAILLDNNIKEVVAAGNAVYWLDGEGSLFTVNSNADLQGELSAYEISTPGASDITSTADGSSVFYLKAGALWQRRSGQAANKLVDNVSNYITNSDGSKIYMVLADQSLVKLENGSLINLSLPGAITDGLDALAINPMQIQGGNTWLGSYRIAWLEDGQIKTE